MSTSTNFIREIKSVNFGVLSTQDILKMSVCQVVNTKLSGPGSVYDERMGPSLDVSKVCITCGNGPDICPGHFGHINLNQPIIHPLFYKYVVNFLKCFCDECHKLIIPDDYMYLYRYDRLSVEARFEAVQKVSEKIDACWHCGKIQAKVCLLPADNSIVKMHKITNVEEDGGGTEPTSLGASAAKMTSIQMTVEEILKIFDGISDDDVRMLGFNPMYNHPRNMIMTVFPVIPSCSRPFIVADGNICDDDLTNQICEIVKANNALCNETSDIKIQKALQSLKFRIHTFYDNSKGRSKHTTSGRAIKGLKERLTSKEGLFRNNLMGKRVNQSARTVIGPDPSLKMDEVGVPNEICDDLTIPEIVSDFNIERLTRIVNSGGANLVVKEGGKKINLAYATFKKGTDLLYGDIVVMHKNGKQMKINDKNYHYVLQPGDKIIRNGVQLEGVKYAERKKFNLEIGNIVHRKLINGDWLLLNRQPTLHKGSMMAVKVVRLPGKSIRFNTEKCASYNADFDGDEMNLHVPASYEAMIELEELSSVKQNIITPQSSKPNIKIIQDSLLGAYKMTKGWKLVRKDIFFQVLSFLPSSYVLRKIQHIRVAMIQLGYKPMAFTGRGLMSVLLPDDFHYHVKGQNGVEDVKIYKGVLYSGAFTKEHLGSSYNSLILLINKEYGSDVVTDFINNVQFLVNNWLLYAGFTVGIGDCLATSKDQIEDTIYKCFIEAKQIEDTTRNPYVRELKINACLSKAKDIGMRIAKEALHPDNNFVTTVTSGSKGDYFNIAQLTGLLGQQNLDGKRIPKMLNRGKRSLPHYPLNEELSIEEEFESRGFIKSSFIHGLNPKEFYMHAITGREGVIQTAMGTAKSGYIQRKIVKCMEDLSSEYDSTVRDASGALFQCSYGQTGYDPTKLVKSSAGGMDCCNVGRLVNRLNKKYE